MTRMKRNEQLAGRLQEVFLDGKWIANTNFRDQLEDVDHEMAVQKVSGLNTLYALTFHIHYYIRGLIQVFEEGKLEIQDKFSFNCPALPDESDWINLKAAFFTDAAYFVSLVQSMPENQLSEPFADVRYGSYERNLEAMIEHGYYHLGQVALLKKWIKAQNQR